MQRLSIYENVRGFTAKLMHTLHLMLTLYVYMYSGNQSFDVVETKVLDILHLLNQGLIYEMQH